MALAGTAKRRSGLNSDGSKAIKRTSSGGSTSSGSSTNSVITPAPPNASLSEKRRMAALISWEKRRKSTAKRAAKDAKEALSKRKANAVLVVPITPPKNKEKKKAALERQKQKQLYRELYAPPPGKKRKVDASSKGGRGSKLKDKQENDPTERKVYTADDRAAAAKLGWERRAQKKNQKQQKQVEQQSATDIRRQAAKLGWEKRRNEKQAQMQQAQMSASDIRRKAAKLGWERRNKKLMAESSGSSEYASDESSGDERSSSGTSSVDSSSTAGKKKPSAAMARKVYTASARRQAAILGWEKRRNEKAARRASATSYDEGTASIALLQPPKRAPSMTTTTETSSATSSRPQKNYRQGTKRSRRLADESTDSYEDEARKVNELVTYLRMTRGWMEFHPSSRHGSGTATYGYIPSGIASFIRSGAISQRTVLDHGTLGVHYALDWDGYGGLKDMINTFGEDYSPYPTEEMMELSKLTEWELGEDLPWREVEAAEEQERLKEEGDNKGKFTTDVKVDQESGTTANAEDVDMEDIMFFANILASLDDSATVPAVEDIGSASKESVMATKFKGRRASNDTTVSSPSILALRGYESSSDDDDDDDDDDESDTKENNQTAATGGNISPMSTLADACEVKKHQHHQHYNPSASGKQHFSHWNFGIC